MKKALSFEHLCLPERKDDGNEPVVGQGEERERLHSHEDIDKEHAAETGLVGDVLLFKQKSLYELRDESRAPTQVCHSQVEDYDVPRLKMGGEGGGVKKMSYSCAMLRLLKVNRLMRPTLLLR